MRYKRLIYSAVAVLIIAVLCVGAGAYAKSTLGMELAHFFIPFSAGSVVRPMTVDKPDGGKVFTRPIVINVNERGILKRIFQPGLEGLSTHWLINIDSKPHRIGMKFTNVNVPITWEVAGAIPWDPQSQTFKEAVDSQVKNDKGGVSQTYSFDILRLGSHSWLFLFWQAKRGAKSSQEKGGITNVSAKHSKTGIITKGG